MTLPAPADRDPRTIQLRLAGTTVPAQHPWPDRTYLQGGESGLVVQRLVEPDANGSHARSYETAFVEAFHDAFPFVRGEGPTVADAETHCWQQASRFLACNEHDYEARGYRNGAGFCRKCGQFASHVFTGDQLGQHCGRCGKGTTHDWHDFDTPDGPLTVFLCAQHVPHTDRSYCQCLPCRVRHEIDPANRLSAADLDAVLTVLTGQET